MADGSTNGLKAALEALGVSAGTVPGAGGDAGQADMFEAQDAALPLPPTKGRSGPQGGRPLGARNKSTEAWSQWVLSRYSSPLTALAELYSRPLEELVEHLQAIADKDPVVHTDKDGVVTRTAVRINPMDVLRLQRDAAVALAPYLHKQQPKAIEVESKQRGIVVLGNLDDVDEAQTVDADDIALPLPPVQQNQGVAEATTPQSDRAQSDIPANALIHRD